METPGPQCGLPFDTPALDYLLCLVGADFFEILANNTNLNAAIKKPPDVIDPDDRFATSDKYWTKTDALEMRAFVGINILMGIKQTPEYNDSWSTDSALNDGYISSVLSKNRYEKLSQYFHCSNPADPINNNDRIHKVRNFVTKLDETFHQMFVPGQCLSVDEAMIKYNGRLSWKQYMPKKPTKWGIKLWFLCDSTSGYCLAFRVYTGRGENTENVRQLGLAYSVVMDLMEHHLLRYHHLYADNFFASLSLVEDLYQADTYYCGTLRKDRIGVPKQILNVPLKKYENAKWQKIDSQITVTNWKDKRNVLVIATNNDGKDVQKPRTKFRQDEIISIPSVVTSYNSNMGGVDHSDQYRAYYSVGRTGRRWWKYLFWGLLNQTLVNAYILWELSTRPHNKQRRTWSLKAFKMAIVHQLVDGYTSRRRTSAGLNLKRPITMVVAKDAYPGHSLVQFGDRKRICVCCKQQRKRTESGHAVQTTFGCSKCMVNLCRICCFREWHVEQ